MVKNRQSGITLVEILLVLAVTSVLIIVGVRSYITFRNDVDVQQVKSNIDVLFQAANELYRAQCIEYRNASGRVTKPGILDPEKGNIYPLRVPASYFQRYHYLPQWPLPSNPIVNENGSDNGYIIQFNLAQFDKTIVTDNDTVPPTTVSLGTIYILKPQVAVLIRDENKALVYKNMLGGDCLSTMQNNVVIPCSEVNGNEGNYVVIERLPSFASPVMSDQLSSMSGAAQFNQMYTTYPITTLTNGLNTDTQFYPCGG
ncbi:MAG TPA: type II secretion system protein [Candidatus Babeliaceae bacterium]|nr:type II secretion system protein [Candidatus Babeliaceae bacterium]